MRRKILTSANNKRIKDLQKLSKKKYRKQFGLFVIEGFRFVESAIDKGVKIKEVYHSSNFVSMSYADELIIQIGDDVETSADDMSKQQKLLSRLDDSVTIYEIADDLFQKISDTVSNQGILAVVEMSENIDYEVTNTNELLDMQVPEISLIIDRVQDAGNLGTIIRTSESAGIKDIFILKGTVDLYSSKVLRSTMGAIFDINFHFVTQEQIIEYTKRNGINMIVTTPHTDKMYYDIELQNPIALVVGNEGNGVSDGLMSEADEKVKIPIFGRSESLNVSIATAIVMYDYAIAKKNIKKTFK